MSQSQVLERGVDQLARGDWRSARQALLRGVDAGGERDLVDVAFCLRRICDCQWLQCAFGDVERARSEVDRVTQALVRLGARPAGGGRFHVPAEPAADKIVAHLVWGVTGLVVRERGRLEHLRLAFGDLTRGGRELVYACAEYLTWVEFDPFTVQVHPDDQELLGLGDDAYARFRTANARDISDRATNLRHLAAVRTGSVSSRTWQRMGDGAVRYEALRLLAGEEPDLGCPGLPARLGRERAIAYARGLRDDTVA